MSFIIFYLCNISWCFIFSVKPYVPVKIPTPFHPSVPCHTEGSWDRGEMTSSTEKVSRSCLQKGDNVPQNIYKWSLAFLDGYGHHFHRFKVCPVNEKVKWYKIGNTTHPRHQQVTLTKTMVNSLFLKYPLDPWVELKETSPKRLSKKAVLFKSSKAP